MKAGCFDNYPSHSNDPYAVKKSKGGDGSEKRIFRPSQGPKSTPTRSIINQNVERRINNLNFRQPITVSIWKKCVIMDRKCKKVLQQTKTKLFLDSTAFPVCVIVYHFSSIVWKLSFTVYIFFFVFWLFRKWAARRNVPLKVISFYHVCFYNTAMK